MAVVRTPDGFEAELARYLYERSEEARAVRVGEKETSEQAAIVERYAGLFTREQHEALREAEGQARGEERERLYRLREAAAGGVIVRELAEESDKLENSILAERVEFGGESLPLRSAQAQLAVLDEYAARDELGELAADASARFNCPRYALMQKGEALDAELSGDPDPVARSAARKNIDLHALSEALQNAARQQDGLVGAAARGVARPRPRPRARRRADIPPGLLPAPHVAVRGALRQGSLRAHLPGDALEPRLRPGRERPASGSIWTTGRRRARGPA